MSNKNKISHCFGQSALTYEQSAEIQLDIANKLASLASPYIHAGSSIFEIGCGTGYLTIPLLNASRCASYVANDISPEMLSVLKRKIVATDCFSVLSGDAELIEWPANINVVASSSAVQWFSEPLEFIAKSTRALKCGNVLCFSTFGPDTFIELRQIGAPGLYFPSLEEWKEKLGSYFDVKEQSVITKVQYYDSVSALFYSIRSSGVNALPGKTSVGKMRGILQQLTHQLNECQKLTLTYEAYLFVAVRR